MSNASRCAWRGYDAPRGWKAELGTKHLAPLPFMEKGLKFSLGEPSVIDPGQPARIDSEGVEVLVRYQRYESANENKLYRAMNQLERIRRIRQGGVPSQRPNGSICRPRRS